MPRFPALQRAPAARQPTTSTPSVKPPLASQGKEKFVPPALRAAMATVQTGDFIFDPVYDRQLTASHFHNDLTPPDEAALPFLSALRGVAADACCTVRRACSAYMELLPCPAFLPSNAPPWMTSPR